MAPRQVGFAGQAAHHIGRFPAARVTELLHVLSSWLQPAASSSYDFRRCAAANVTELLHVLSGWLQEAALARSAPAKPHWGSCLREVTGLKPTTWLRPSARSTATRPDRQKCSFERDGAFCTGRAQLCNSAWSR